MDSDLLPGASGLGVATFADASGEPLLDVRFAAFGRGAATPPGGVQPAGGPPGTSTLDEVDATAAARAAGLVGADGSAPWGALVGRDEARGVRRRVVAVRIPDLTDPPADAGDVYLRLHLLSSRQARPHSISLDGVFGLLRNVAWTSQGPCDAEDFDATRLRLLAEGRFPHVHGLDKFPPMLDYVAPAGVRVADASRVRLGAHLAPGTTVMHEGFCNFNAGTLGTSMVEGRISAGVVVGADSDVGGGASIMGTLSGGGKEVISVGERCLIGANAGIGISLGDDCVVEAGLYVTAGTLVTLPDGEVSKGAALSGVPGLLYRRHGVTGRIETVPRRGVAWQGLNAALHANT